MDELKPWKCPSNQHMLGQVLRNGSGIRQLILYRQAVDLETMDGDVDVMATIEGLVLDVRCSICGRVRTWVPGEESLRRMMEGMEE